MVGSGALENAEDSGMMCFGWTPQPSCYRNEGNQGAVVEPCKISWFWWVAAAAGVIIVADRKK
jgi:hypothetical protein